MSVLCKIKMIVILHALFKNSHFILVIEKCIVYHQALIFIVPKAVDLKTTEPQVNLYPVLSYKTLDRF